MNSRLADLFDLNKIDWVKTEEFALSSLVKKACDLWNSGLRSTEDISNKMYMSQNTIINYLKKGAKLNWCDYSVEQSFKERGKKNSIANGKKVICIENGLIFPSVTKLKEEFEKLFNIKITRKKVYDVCNNKIKSYKGFTFKYID